MSDSDARQLTAPPGPGEVVRELAVDSIRPNPYQPRRTFDQEGLAELARSIEAAGVFQPIIVRRPDPNLNRYELIAGERRLRATKMTERKTIPAIVRVLDDQTMMELAVLEKLKPVLEAGKPARSVEFSAEEMPIVKGLFLLTIKPVLYVANVAEDDMANPEASKYMDVIKEHVAGDGEVIGIAAAAEEQIAEMDEEEKADFLEMEGVEEPGLNRLVRAAYQLLGLETFFTAGGKETRAWTFRKGTKAPQAAGIIHSDFERGFIRAEVMSFEDLDQYGSHAAVKEAGKLRLEGKDYVMQDGDIVEFRFNV